VELHTTFKISRTDHGNWLRNPWAQKGRLFVLASRQSFDKILPHNNATISNRTELRGVRFSRRLGGEFDEFRHSRIVRYWTRIGSIGLDFSILPVMYGDWRHFKPGYIRPKGKQRDQMTLISGERSCECGNGGWNCRDYCWLLKTLYRVFTVPPRCNFKMTIAENNWVKLSQGSGSCTWTFFSRAIDVTEGIACRILRGLAVHLQNGWPLDHVCWILLSSLWTFPFPFLIRSSVSNMHSVGICTPFSHGH
jgi:hypothetical protein